MDQAPEDVLDELRALYHQQAQEGGDPIHKLQCALYHCWSRRWPVPQWLYAALHEILEQQRKKRPGRGQRSAVERYGQGITDFWRYAAVRALMEQGIDHDELWEAAAHELEGTEHFGEANTIRDSYYRMHHGK